MKRYMFATGTVTYAIKGRDLLRRKGFLASADRVTSGPGSAGCGYVILVSGDRTAAETLLRQAGIRILEINEVPDEKRHR